MNFHSDNFNSNLILTFSGKGVNDTSNSLNDYLKSGIGFQLLSNNSNFKEFVIADTSNITSNYFASLRIAVEKSQISLKSITSNNIIYPLIINSNIFITSNIGIGKSNPSYNIDVLSNINADNYFIKGANISNVFTTSNNLQTSFQNLSNLTNAFTKSGSTLIYTNSNVGINKNNPVYNLDVAGNINFTGNLTKNGVIFNNFSGNYLDLNGRPNITWDLSGTHIYNNNSGNVGIGSLIPFYKLDVIGDINFTGRLLKNKVEYSGNWNTIGGKPTFASVAFTGDFNDLINQPNFSGGLSGLVVNWGDIQGKPTFVQVATTGNYNHLNNLPTLFSGSYNDLTNRPSLAFNVVSSGSTHINNTNTGNVGIKQSSPSYTLDVNGDINFTGNIRKNGSIYGGIWGNDMTGRPILSSVATSGHWNDILGKPTYFDTDWNTKVANKPTLFDGTWNSLSGKPTYFKATWNDMDNKPTLFSGSYNDLQNKPAFHAFALSGKWTDLEDTPVLSSVAVSGNYYDLRNLPTLFSSNYNDLVGKPDLFNGDFNSLTNRPYVAFVHNSTTNNMTSQNSGNMGIGIATPSQKLDVNGNINIATGFNYMRNGIALTNSVATFSDSRIKTNIEDISDISALEKIMKVEPKNYNYIDVDERGSMNVIGFIAQQIKEVIPEAIVIGEEFIPNIYKYYEIISSNTILINDANINKIFIGNIIKIKVNQTTLITKIIDKINKIIKIDIEIDVKAKCLIYGVKINDFHFIDKNYIYTLNVCATQEIYRRLEEQKKEIEELKTKINSLMN
jgi:hypothetical protein